jgi:hypothetical protein
MLLVSAHFHGKEGTMDTLVTVGEMKQRVVANIERSYLQAINVFDGIAAGKWTVEDWNDVDHQPPVSTVDDLLMAYHAYLLGASGVCFATGLLTQTEAAEIDKKYCEQRPDIFWPYIRHGYKVHPNRPVT